MYMYFTINSLTSYSTIFQLYLTINKGKVQINEAHCTCPLPYRIPTISHEHF